MNIISNGEYAESLIQELLKKEIKEIWFTFTHFYFVINDQEVISISINSTYVESPNGKDEIITHNIKKLESIPTSSDYNLCIAKKVLITKVYKGKTAIWFSRLRKLTTKEKEEFNSSSDAFTKLQSEANFCNQEYCDDPDNLDKEIMNTELVNIVDNGYLFEIDGRYLCCLTIGNSYGFTFNESKPFDYWSAFAEGPYSLKEVHLRD